MKDREELRKEFIKAKRALFDKYYSFLNGAQRKAVYSVNGPLLVLAGAGSGKTTVLVNRIAHIIKFGNAYEDESLPGTASEYEPMLLERGQILSHDEIGEMLAQYKVKPCKAWEVLALTFTNKAASEMKERLAKILGSEADIGDSVTAGTFHSVCTRILRRFGENIGLSRDFTIYDTEDSKKVISEVLKQKRLDEKIYQPKNILSAISRAKDRLYTPSDFAAEAGDNFNLKNTAEIYYAYQEKLEEANAVDFDDIIVKTVKLLKECDSVREYYQRRYKYVCVDEYQDTNYAQFILAELFSGGYRNIMVVGDDDQSIYRFRGATIENILSFDRVFDDARVVKLEENYRSTSVILNAANSIIANNNGRHDKALFTNKEGGEKISLVKLDNQFDEGVYLTEEIMRLTADGKRKLGDIAILYRMNAQSGSLEKAFVKSGIPYRLLCGTRFYDRKEVKDMLAYLSLLNNPSDNLRLARIINEPKRKIGATTFNAVLAISAETKRPALDIIRHANEFVALSRSAATLKLFADLMDELSKAKENSSVSELIKKVYEDSGYREMLTLIGSEEGKERADNILELVSQAVEYENDNDDATLAGFLEDVALVSDVDNYDTSVDAVVLMTIHSAKGLEFPIVILPGMENGIFPSMQSQISNDDMEEERRLAYVAVTRAKEKLIITYVRERLLYGMTQYNQLSKFAREIPTALISSTDKTVKGSGYSSSGSHRDAFFASKGRYDYDEGDRIPFDFSKMTKKAEIQTQKPVQNKKPEVIEQFCVGDSVIHARFGKGIILSATKMGSDILYEIMFDKEGTKKLMGTYAKLKKDSK